MVDTTIQYTGDTSTDGCGHAGMHPHRQAGQSVQLAELMVVLPGSPAGLIAGVIANDPTWVSNAGGVRCWRPSQWVWWCASSPPLTDQKLSHCIPNAS